MRHLRVLRHLAVLVSLNLSDRLAIEGQILAMLGLLRSEHRKEQGSVRAELKTFSDDELTSFRDELKLDYKEEAK